MIVPVAFIKSHLQYDVDLFVVDGKLGWMGNIVGKKDDHTVGESDVGIFNTSTNCIINNLVKYNITIIQKLK